MADLARNTGPAAVAASAAAGPIVIVTLAFGVLLTGQPVTYTLEPVVTANALPGALIFSCFAMLVALVPNFIGARMMAFVASRNVGLRHPAIWAMAGATMSGGPAWLVLGGEPGNSVVAGWAAIGAMSAIVCRLRVRWEHRAAPGGMPRTDLAFRPAAAGRVTV